MESACPRKRKTRRSYAERARGQMLVVVMLMITTVIIMFGMTVSVGHLVQSKINLQNSVDLSAMSAASYQARYMNALSVANYRIRALEKFFLMDAYVTQARFNYRAEDWKNGGSGTISDPEKTFASCEQARNYDPVPKIFEGGRGVDDQTNICYQYGQAQAKTITPIIASPIPGFNPIYIFINLTLLQIAAEFERSCTEWQGQNRAWVKWAVERARENTEEATVQRAKVIQGFLNDLGVTHQNNSVLLGRGGGAAYATYISNLIGSLNDQNQSDNRLLFLNDESDRALDVADLPLSQKKMGLAYVEPTWSAAGCSIQVNAGGASATAMTMTQGFSKTPSKIVQVAMLANGVNSKILFWPQGLEPTMVAVSAAKPFGSRIGPPASYFANEGDGTWGNVALYPGDRANTLSAGGLGHRDILAFALRATPEPSNGMPISRSKRELQQVAYAPTIFDGMYYSVFDPANPFAPTDVLPALDMPSARMDDRGGSALPDPYAWVNPLPPLSRYYNHKALMSAWSPDGEPRSGYQIKLIAIEEACSNSPAGDYLHQLCATGGATF